MSPRSLSRSRATVSGRQASTITGRFAPSRKHTASDWSAPPQMPPTGISRVRSRVARRQPPRRRPRPPAPRSRPRPQQPQPRPPRQATPPPSGVKPELAGLLDRQHAPKVLVAPALGGWVVNVTWASLQATQGGPIAGNNAIDQALALIRTNPAYAHMHLRLRVKCGSRGSRLGQDPRRCAGVHLQRH